MNPFARLTLPRLREDLQRHGESATFNRLGTSQHVTDLRVIFAGTFVVAATAIGCAAIYGVTRQWSEFVTTLIGAVGAIACSIFAWIYLTGSARLGVVDLFACEISTLTRVGTVVNVARTLVAQYEQAVERTHELPAPPPPGDTRPAGDEAQAARLRFTSEENYFPVFETTTKDLQQLEEKVVINVTAFYTYMKTMRDYLRRLSDLGFGSSASARMRVEILINTIYMLFLAYESARKSIRELVEYEPERDECLIVILLTELVAYRFLLGCFVGMTAAGDALPSGHSRAELDAYECLVPALRPPLHGPHAGRVDLRYRRLVLRSHRYVAELAGLLSGGVATVAETDETWKAARESVPDLRRIAAEIFEPQRLEQAIAVSRETRGRMPSR